jgi:hypothetical protein
MSQGNLICHRSAGERGVASVLLLFAMSAFSVMSVAALTTGLGSAPTGQTFGIFRRIPDEALTKFVADMVVPNDWRAQGTTGSYQFQLPVLVPETAGEENGASAAWHAMTDVPGLEVCCESQAGVCAERKVPSGGAAITDWNPTADDAMWMSFDLASRADASHDPAKGDLVTATVSTSTDGADGSPMSCQLEFDDIVVAKGTARLRQVPREDGSGLSAEVVAGSMTLAVRTK